MFINLHIKVSQYTLAVLYIKGKKAMLFWELIHKNFINLLLQLVMIELVLGLSLDHDGKKLTNKILL
jgi:hypothetical protein